MATSTMTARAIRRTDPVLELVRIGDLLDVFLAELVKARALPTAHRLKIELKEDLDKMWKSSASKALQNNLHALEQAATAAQAQAAVEQLVQGMDLDLRSAFESPVARQRAGRRLKRLYTHGKREVSEKIGLAYSFALVDQRAIDWLARDVTYWCGTVFDRELRERIREVSRETVLRRGLAPREAAKLLRDDVLARELGVKPGGRTRIVSEIPARFAGNPDYYTSIVADAAASDARSFANIQAFREAGATSYAWSTTGDERVCDRCAVLEGTVFTIEQGIAQVEARQNAGSPEAARLAAPWAGNAESLTKIIGDRTGSDAAAALAAHGYAMPPLHGLCRCTVEMVGAPTVAAEPIPVAPRPTTRPAPRRAKRTPEMALVEHAGLREARGAAVPLDAGDIENHAVNFRIESMGGADWTVVRFKLTERAGNRVAKLMETSLRGRERELVYYRRAKPMADKKLLRSLEKRDLLSMDAKSIAATVDDQVVHMVRRREALMNYVEITIDTGDPRKAFQVYSGIAEKLGIQNASAFPEAAHVRMLKQSKILTQWDATAWAELRAREMTPELVNEIFERAVSRQPILRTILDDMKAREVMPGHIATYSAAQAKAMRSAGVHALKHASRADVDVIADILTTGKNGGLLSSTTRYDRGTFTRGLSTSSDFGTGGADGAFTRMVPTGHTVRASGDSFVFDISPDELGRSDWWAFNSDSFGAAGPSDYSERLLASKVKGTIDAKRLWMDNEVMFQKGVPLSSIRRVVTASSTRRRALLQELRDRGVQTINGKPIDEFVVMNP